MTSNTESASGFWFTYGQELSAQRSSMWIRRWGKENLLNLRFQRRFASRHVVPFRNHPTRPPQ